MPMTDFLEGKRKEIQQRLDELRPSVDEYTRLEAAAAALAGIGAGDGASPSSGRGRARRGPGRPRGSRSSRPASTTTTAPRKARAAAGTGRRAGRRKGSGSRSAEALALVQAHPGITIPELATRMKLRGGNYLYRVLPALAEEGKVRREDSGWHPAAP
jgi:hypothetical protein